MKRDLLFRSLGIQILLWIWNRRAYGLALCLSWTFIISPQRTNANALSDDRVISGTVRDESGQPLPGVNVVIKGTSSGTATDSDGVYKISIADDNATLVFTFIGMKTMEVVVGGRTTVDVALEADSGQLEEIVVVGYGTQKRKDLTGAVVSLGTEKFSERPVANALDAMVGQSTGVQIFKGNASPGQLSSVVIRGISSVSAGYEPLFVIDGFPTDQGNFNAINPADIQSIEVLKDASATAIYGSRGANGVILVTTKSAKEGKSTISVDLTTGFAQVNERDFYKVLNAAEYVQYSKEIVANNGGTVSNAVANWDGKTDTNWQKQVYQTAPYQNYSLSATGGTGKTLYSFSAGYIDQQGIVKGTGYQKYSMRAKIDIRPSERLKIGINIAPNYTVSKNMPDGDFISPQGAATFMPPIVPVRMPDGSYADTQDFPGMSAIQLANPLQIIEEYQSKTYSTFILANADLEYEITKGLRFRTSLGINTSSAATETYNPSTLPPLPHPSLGTYNNNSFVNWLNENTLSYSKVINNDHSINVLAGYTIQDQNSSNVYMQANNFPTNSVFTLNGGSVLPANSGTTRSEWALISYLARANYDYKGKYLLTATIRSDGSSRFGANKRYGTFPSGAVAWRVSEESFMKGISQINNLKIRASYGRTGNNLIGDFASVGLLSTTNQPFGGGSGSNNIGLTITQPGNPNLTWEIADQFDIGMDLAMFRNRLNLTVDYYDRETQGLLLNVNVPTTTGYASSLQNIGKMQSTGWEFSANYQVLDKAFKWNIGGNLSLMANQTVLALGPDGSDVIGFFGTLVTRVGGRLEAGRYLHAVGIIRPGDISSGYPLFGGAAPPAKAGDYKYEDVNKDGKIDNFNQSDGKLLGDNINKGVFGINNSFIYKNFDMKILIEGIWGGYNYDLANQLGQLGVNGINTFKKFYDGRYVSEAQPGNGSVPRAGFFGAGTPNDFFMNPTAYTRIRNITLGYNIPLSSGLSKAGFKSARAFISIDNLATFTDFHGGNPGATRFTSASGGEVRLTGQGRALGNNSAPSVPYPQTFSLGVSARF